jgi:Flp pilus assembly pilin Flp
MKKILGYVRDEQGVETLEWIAVGALIVMLAVAVYPGTLKTGIDAVVADITTKLTGLVS